jgi:signal transduction histidine kinase
MGDTLSDAALVGLLESLDAGIVLLRPILGALPVVVDAEVVWASQRARSVWGGAPGVLASDVLPDFEDWLAAASIAWRGPTMHRLIEADSGRSGWTRAISVVRRVGEYLSEITLDRSGDQELLERIQQIEQGFRGVLDELPLTVISSVAGRGSLEYVSANAETLTGRPLDELRRLGDWVKVIDPEDVEVAGNVRKLLHENGEFEMPGRIVHADGDHRYIDFRMVSRASEHDEPRRFLITMLNTTKERRLREQAEEGRRLSSLSRTAGAFGHEFSSLLQIITGHLDTIERAKSPDDTNRAIAAMRDASSRASELLAGLVAFASSRPGTLEPVSIPKMCDVTRSQLRARLAHNVELEIDLAEGLPLVMVAPSAMQQIMFQLVDNAAESMPEGGRVRITVREQPHAACHLMDGPGPGCWVSIAVADTGRGIERSHLGYVWEPFHTTHTGPEARGRGLGLSVVHGAVHQYDGHVTLESHVGVGTTVTVYLQGVPGSTS